MASTYATIEDLRAYAQARGLSLPDGDEALQQLLVKANDYIESLESRFQGQRTYGNTAWPRLGVTLHGEVLNFDEVPNLVIQAECQLACDAYTTELQPNSSGFAVTSETVDVISVSYAAPTGASAAKTTFTKAMSLLEPLMIPTRLRTQRV